MSAGLIYFMEVARLGSIRAAGERLNVAASAVSRQIRMLELEYGATLLRRSTRGVTLTPAGDVLLGYARLAEAERVRARQSIDALNGLTRGHVRLASIDGVIAGPVSDVIAAFQRRHPGVTFELQSKGSEAVVEDVRRGRADIGFAFHLSSDEGVKVVHQFTDPVHAIVGAGHSLAKRDVLGLEEALQHPLALPDTTFGVRRLVDTVCEARQLRPVIMLETNSIEALRGFARSGAGLTLLPYLTTRREVELGTVKALQLDSAGFASSSVDIVIRSDEKPSAACETFLDTIGCIMGPLCFQGSLNARPSFYEP